MKVRRLFGDCCRGEMRVADCEDLIGSGFGDFSCDLRQAFGIVFEVILTVRRDLGVAVELR